MTIRDALAAALKHFGEQQLESKSRKYLTFTRSKGGYYFIGKAGSLRIGAVSTRSMPCSTEFKRKLLESTPTRANRAAKQAVAL